MSIDICAVCENFVDTDEYPEAYMDLAGTTYCICGGCQDKFDDAEELRDELGIAP